LKNNATQLIFPDLFCLQDGLKERELRVFIMDNGEELIPGYLEFIKEIVHYVGYKPCLYFARTKKVAGFLMVLKIWLRLMVVVFL
jgi:hypothetical protein